jgi:hypothetical protein
MMMVAKCSLELRPTIEQQLPDIGTGDALSTQDQCYDFGNIFAKKLEKN